MSWGISPNATEKEKIFADYNDSLNGMNCADGLSYYHYSKIFDLGRELADKEYNQALDDFAKWVNENQMKEFNIDIWISNSDKHSCNMNDLVKLFLKNIRSN